MRGVLSLIGEKQGVKRNCFLIIRKRFLRIFKRRKPHEQGLGKVLPNKIYQRGQNRRYADFGTVVESCSKKLPLSSAALVCGYTGLLHKYSDCGGVFYPLFTTTTVKRVRFGKHSGKFFIFPVCSLQQSGSVVCQRFLKMGAKKSSKPFQDLLLICRCDGRRY